MPDHVQLLVATDPTHAPQFLADQFKGSTSRMLRQEFSHLVSAIAVAVDAQRTTSGFVGTVTDTTIRRYIAQQQTRS